MSSSFIFSSLIALISVWWVLFSVESALRCLLRKFVDFWNLSPPYRWASKIVWLLLCRFLGIHSYSKLSTLSSWRASMIFLLFLFISRFRFLWLTTGFKTPAYSSRSNPASFIILLCSYFMLSRLSFLWSLSAFSSSHLVTFVFLLYLMRLWPFAGFGRYLNYIWPKSSS